MNKVVQKIFENTLCNNFEFFYLRENAENIYSKIKNLTKLKKNNVGLLVGKVQSGKTANIITLIGLCMENGYRLSVVFLSDTNNLFIQNYSRFKNAFDNINRVKIFSQYSNGDFDKLSKKELNDLYSGGYSIIICSLKHYSHISRIQQIIDQTSYSKDYSLIIDDEGDDISQNIYKCKLSENKGNIIELYRSTNNKALVDLKENLKIGSYLLVTATPQSILLLNEAQSLFPDFLYYIQPSRGYTGLKEFINEGKIEIISDMNLNSANDINSFLPNSFYQSFCFYLAGAFLRKEKGDKGKHSFFLFSEKLIKIQQHFYDVISDLLKIKTYGLEYQNEDGSKFFKDVINEIEKISKSCDFSENKIRDDLILILKSINLICFNSKDSANDLRQLMSNNKYNVVIGSDMLDRGVTIEGLAVSYVIRDNVNSKGQIDTLLQKARWFGYRRDYFDYCKVYMSYPLYVKYKKILESEKYLYSNLENLNLKDSFSREDLYLCLDNSMLIPANPNKAKYVKKTIL